MNRETSIHSSDNLIVVDRSRQQRRMIIAAVIGLAVVMLVAFLVFGRAGHKPPQAPSGAAQVPTVTVDAPSTRVIDDAISVLPAGGDGALRLFVSIADAAEFVAAISG